MHRCLQIPELFGMICEFTDDSATLFNLATVCHLLSEPALDVLWAIYGDLIPLLKTMPPDLWQEVSDDEYQWKTALSFKRSPIPSDWNAFRKYSPKVYKICVYLKEIRYMLPLGWTGSFSTINQNVLQEIQALEPFANNMFPNVRSLDYQSSDMAVAPFSMFLGPNIKCLRAASVTCPRSILRSIFDSISSTSRNIRVLKWVIKRPEWSGEALLELKDLMSDLVCRLDSLETLQVSDIDLHPHCVKHVSSLPGLHTLSWGCGNIDGLNYVPAVYHFPKLRHYTHSHPPSLSVIRDFLKSFSRHRLETLQITDSYSCALSEVKHTFECIDQQVDHSSLVRISFDIYSKYETYGFAHPTELNDMTIDSAILEPLLSFYNLKSLSLTLRSHLPSENSRYFFSLDDRCLKEAATAWPNLELLFFGFMDPVGPGWLKPYKVTFGGILSLTKGCPKLENLSLRFTLNPEDIRTQQLASLEDLACCSALRFFDIGDSPIRDGDAFAPLFVQMFPNLFCLSRSGQDPEWDKVDSALSRSDANN